MQQAKLGRTLLLHARAFQQPRWQRQHRWAPYVAYALAGVIGFSLVATDAHFPPDVFIGAALGYVIARYNVVRQ